MVTPVGGFLSFKSCFCWLRAASCFTVSNPCSGQCSISSGASDPMFVAEIIWIIRSLSLDWTLLLYSFLVGGIPTHLQKYEMGRMTSIYEMEQKCLKPPTSFITSFNALSGVHKIQVLLAISPVFTAWSHGAFEDIRIQLLSGNSWPENYESGLIRAAQQLGN